MNVRAAVNSIWFSYTDFSFSVLFSLKEFAPIGLAFLERNLLAVTENLFGPLYSFLDDKVELKKGLSEVTSTLIGLKILLVYSDLPLGLLIELVISGTGLS